MRCSGLIGVLEAANLGTYHFTNVAWGTWVLLTGNKAPGSPTDCMRLGGISSYPQGCFGNFPDSDFPPSMTQISPWLAVVGICSGKNTAPCTHPQCNL